MSNSTLFYQSYGKRAARLSTYFPGLGQLHNRHFGKGAAVITLFSFSIAFLFLTFSHPSRNSSSSLAFLLFLLPPIIWATSIMDAYYSGVQCREKDARRYNVQILITVRGADSSKSEFEEVGVTKNLSKVGACLILTREVSEGTPLHLKIDGFSKTRARVVWSKETGNRNERLVGVELLKPLSEL
jgi:hypothetical protein